jgi:hypothetical protein
MLPAILQSAKMCTDTYTEEQRVRWVERFFDKYVRHTDRNEDVLTFALAQECYTRFALSYRDAPLIMSNDHMLLVAKKLAITHRNQEFVKCRFKYDELPRVRKAYTSVYSPPVFPAPSSQSPPAQRTGIPSVQRASLTPASRPASVVADPTNKPPKGDMMSCVPHNPLNAAVQPTYAAVPASMFAAYTQQPHMLQMQSAHMQNVQPAHMQHVQHVQSAHMQHVQRVQSAHMQPLHNPLYMQMSVQPHVAKAVAAANVMSPAWLSEICGANATFSASFLDDKHMKELAQLSSNTKGMERWCQAMSTTNFERIGNPAGFIQSMINNCMNAQ